jgi:hypothetical protein
VPPHIDPTPTSYNPPGGSPGPSAPITAPAAWLSPAQRQWLIGLLVGIGGVFLGRWGIPLPPVPPFLGLSGVAVDEVVPD